MTHDNIYHTLREQREELGDPIPTPEDVKDWLAKLVFVGCCLSAVIGAGYLIFG